MALYYVEGNPDPAHPLRRRVIPTALAALQAYAIALGKPELRLVEPLPALIPLYCSPALGFELVTPGEKSHITVGAYRQFLQLDLVGAAVGECDASKLVAGCVEPLHRPQQRTGLLSCRQQLQLRDYVHDLFCKERLVRRQVRRAAHDPLSLPGLKAGASRGGMGEVRPDPALAQPRHPGMPVAARPALTGPRPPQALGCHVDRDTTSPPRSRASAKAGSSLTREAILPDALFPTG